MSGIPEIIATDLARYFERKLTVKGDAIGCEPEGTPSNNVFGAGSTPKSLPSNSPASTRSSKSPSSRRSLLTREANRQVTREGYTSEFHEETKTVVLRHYSTGICVLTDCMDLVERIEFRSPSSPTRIVFFYFNMPIIFEKVAKLCRTEPHDAMKLLLEKDVLKATDCDDRGNASWYGHLTPLAPEDLARRNAAGGITARGDEPWLNMGLCIALHVLAEDCRSNSASMDILEFRAPGPPKLEVDYGVQFIHAANRLDIEAMQGFLEKGANPDFADARGWTALHTAVSFKRPCWDLLDVLLEVCDVCARTHNGDLALDLAESCGQIEVGQALRAKMATHKKGKHLLG